jgi:hypothetical protein
MELMEGPTLAERIRSGTIPLEEALSVARQVAEALKAAHERGIVHRDLKPANIKVTPEGTVKVLDFGLAKALATEDSASDISNSSTLTATQAGVILGTAAYMSPEQAKGKTVDRRADIWAFGCVLYEMLSGKRVFEGETVSDTLAAVLKSKPEWSALVADTPPRISELVRRCLTKDPKQRLQAIGEARIVIEETLSGDVGAGLMPALGRPSTLRSFATAEDGQGSPLQSWRRALLVAGGFGLGAMLAALAFTMGLFRKPIPKPQPIRFTNTPPVGYTIAPDPYAPQVAISPDGRMIAFAAADSDGNTSLWVRALDATAAQRLENTDGAALPFWSPDSQFIGFFTNGKLMRILVSGGSPGIISVFHYAPCRICLLRGCGSKS